MMYIIQKELQKVKLAYKPGSVQPKP